MGAGGGAPNREERDQHRVARILMWVTLTAMACLGVTIVVLYLIA